MKDFFISFFVMLFFVFVASAFISLLMSDFGESSCFLLWGFFAYKVADIILEKAEDDDNV